jgi:hypothetical protein
VLRGGWEGVRGEEAEAGFARVKPWREPGVFPSGGMECKGSEEQLGAAPGEGSPETVEGLHRKNHGIYSR